MPQPVDLRIAIGLPPARAVEYFRSKGYAVTSNWHDLDGAAHAKAFTVSGVARMDVLQDMHDEVERGIKGEITQRDFINNLEPRLKAKGWWGPQVLVDPQTGDARLAQAGSPARLRTIFRTNLQAAFMAGRYRQMMENIQFRPYWQYVAVMDQRTRPAHAAMNGLVFRYDDPFWNFFFPPCGFNCRCTVRALSFANIEERGISTSVSGDYLRQVWAVDKTTGVTEQVSVFKTPSMRRAGRTDMGWNYNPGSAAWQPDLNAYNADIARQYLASAVTGPDFARFFAAKVGGDFPIAVIGAELRRSVGAKSQAVLLSAEALAKNLAAHPELTIADYQALPRAITQGQLISRDGATSLLAVHINGRLYYVAVNAMASGRALYLISFRAATGAP